MFAVFGNASGGRREQRLPLEMIEKTQQIGRGYDFDLPCPSGFGALHRRTHQPAADFGRMERGQQHAWRRCHTPVQPQLSDHDITRQCFGVDDSHRAQQCQRNRQIIMRPFLRQVGR